MSDDSHNLTLFVRSPCSNQVGRGSLQEVSRGRSRLLGSLERSGRHHVPEAPCAAALLGAVGAAGAQPQRMGEPGHALRPVGHGHSGEDS